MCIYIIHVHIFENIYETRGIKGENYFGANLLLYTILLMFFAQNVGSERDTYIIFVQAQLAENKFTHRRTNEMRYSTICVYIYIYIYGNTILRCTK